MNKIKDMFKIRGRWRGKYHLFSELRPILVEVQDKGRIKEIHVETFRDWDE